ncbi:MAG: polyprenyl synthetase family protein [Bacteroidota bacterium]|nr:polyprenyl synthetase family protein [Bacteroidota bacterium]
MKAVEKFKKPILIEMEEFENKFRLSMKSHVALLNRITYYIVNRKGKQMRPMFVFLVAKMFDKNKFGDKCYRAASVIELIHTATLVHDDVVDESYFRRGFFSINSIWKNKIAVLVGDYLLSKGLLLCIENNDFDLLKIISSAVKEMSEGELLQIEKAKKLDINVDTYFKIIKKKTASLISSCCALGASSVNATEDEIRLISEFGELIGIAFQIKDDLFDYSNNNIGKPVGIDIKEKKMTLPLIHVINTISKKDKKWLIKIFRKNYKTKNSINSIISYVAEKGGVEYAKNQMFLYQKKALEKLKKFPENQFRFALEEMVEFVISRKK